MKNETFTLLFLTQTLDLKLQTKIKIARTAFIRVLKIVQFLKFIRLFKICEKCTLALCENVSFFQLVNSTEL
jgi:hypothetical protein